jgi:hypothetical protein
VGQVNAACALFLQEFRSVAADPTAPPFQGIKLA